MDKGKTQGNIGAHVTIKAATAMAQKNSPKARRIMSAMRRVRKKLRLVQLSFLRIFQQLLRLRPCSK
jgi:hypothetical protein